MLYPPIRNYLSLLLLLLLLSSDMPIVISLSSYIPVDIVSLISVTSFVVRFGIIRVCRTADAGSRIRHVFMYRTVVE